VKIRKGFVSNSSSSSFTCDVCGSTESGMDLCLSDIGMSECENGHTICDSHKLKVDKELTAQEKKNKWVEQKLSNIQYWSKSQADYAPKYVKQYKEELERIIKLKGDELEESFECGDGYDWYEEYLYDSGFPEQECPICQFESLMDSTLAEYVLKTQSKTREDFLTIFKSQFPNYQALQTFLKED
jgi:hypothetical protein